MPRATIATRRARVLVLVDATAAPRADDELRAYVDAVVSGLDADLIITCQGIDAERLKRLAPSATIEVGPPAIRYAALRMLWREFQLPRIARRHDVDAVHSPWPPVPLLLARPRVVTVHERHVADRSVPTQRRSPLWTLVLRATVRISDEILVPRHEIAVALEHATAFAASEALVLPPPANIEAFAAAHRVAYRSAAALVPSETGPISLPNAESTPHIVDGGESEAAH